MLDTTKKKASSEHVLYFIDKKRAPTSISTPDLQHKVSSK
jgi:hypothetical protein